MLTPALGWVLLKSIDDTAAASVADCVTVKVSGTARGSEGRKGVGDEEEGERAEIAGEGEGGERAESGGEEAGEDNERAETAE